MKKEDLRGKTIEEVGELKEVMSETDSVEFQNSAENEGNDICIPTDSCQDVEKIDFDLLMRKKRFSLFCIRCFDIFASVVGLLFLLIPFVIISFIIKATSKGKVFFTQVRIGKNEKPFTMLKFRTMVSEAEQLGLQLTVGEDARITKIGRFLRKTKIDELPQLFNVLIGQMSFVGPRPEVPRYVELYDDYQKNILRIRPGITEIASIEFKNENRILADSDNPEKTYVEVIMPKKIILNMRYMQRMGFWYNIGIILKTLMAVLR